MNEVENILKDVFKLSDFRPGQKDVIDRLLDGKSVLAVFPTGGGKSLCYQLPALVFDGLTLVVSPLIALMKDQVDGMLRLGVAAARLDSTLDKDETAELYANLRGGKLKLLYISPERLKNERFLERLSTVKISLLAVDEAHCISEWGHNFRPEYLTLALSAKKLKVERILALTATATPPVAVDICKQFSISTDDHIQTSFKRENLRLRVRACTESQRMSALIQILNQHPSSDSIVVYATLQKTAEDFCLSLRQAGLNAGYYHAGLKDDDRAAMQDQFMNGEVAIVVATIAFGMGIDKSNIRAVYHFNIPKSMENYVQEIGRAGRDGLPSTCEIFAVADDLRVLENFSYGDTPSLESLTQLVEHILDQDSYFHISTYELSHRFDLKSAVLSTALTYLELFDVIAADAPFYAEYKIKFTVPPETILESFDLDRRKFLATLFGAGQQGSAWLTLDMLTIPVRISEPKGRIVKALEYLEGLGSIELKVSGLRHGYRKLWSERDSNAEKLVQKLSELFSSREKRDIARLYSVVDLINSPKCLSLQLLEYFGEVAGTPCGICSHCLKENTDPLLPPAETPLTAKQVSEIESVVAEDHMVLRQPRQIARFLCGLPSPAMARSPLKKHPAFGSFASSSFVTVLSEVADRL